MQYIRMMIMLLITVLIIAWVNNNKSRFITVCVIYYVAKVINDIFFVSTIELANAFGFSYQLGDMFTFIMLGVLILDVCANPRIYSNIYTLFLFLLSSLILISTFSGLFSFGFTSEWIGDFRTFYIFLVGILYFARFFKVEDIQEHMKEINIAMWSILIVSSILWVLDIALDFHPLYSQYNGTLSDGGSTMRFVQSYEVLVIAIYALYRIREDIDKKGYIGMAGLAFSMAVILFQHRSVWLAFGLGLIVLFVLERKSISFSRTMLIEIVGSIIAAYLLIALGQGDIVAHIQEAFVLLKNIVTGGSLENTTASTRESIAEAVRSDLTGIAAVIGRPFGYGYGTSIGWQTSPHSGYMRMLGRTGYVGLVIFILFIVTLFINTIRKNIKYLPAFIVCIAAFMYGYDFTWICGLVLGATIRMVTDNSSSGEDTKEL